MRTTLRASGGAVDGRWLSIEVLLFTEMDYVVAPLWQRSACPPRIEGFSLPGGIVVLWLRCHAGRIRQAAYDNTWVLVYLSLIQLVLAVEMKNVRKQIKCILLDANAEVLHSDELWKAVVDRFMVLA